MANTLFYRSSLIVVHVVANIIAVSYLVNYDITASWLSFFSFTLVFALLLFIFIRHLISYLHFLKSKK